ncbi:MULTISPECIES: ABC transporter substrate-binding protein [Halorubrum]|uniref:ABC transporter substrate-binding protein n=1 Tax=Halorubrum hochstenium ATCC 700873 TaxID=1227481 RepID=M0F685_9EURY|nr:MULTISPECIES: ABC transporter substrate-binding protein [Halorubrum]ELZ55450.1 ABC transporter substrate-binding protein [Halorubrum hochstenium ATCC 700873]
MYRNGRISERSRRELLAATTGVAAVGLAGCLGSDAEQTADSRTPLSERTLRYGGVMALSGGLGSVGKPIADAVELPGRQLEASDVEAGVEWRIEDSETTARGGIDAMRTLVDAGYPAVAGPLGSDVTLQAVQQASIPAEVVNCSPASTTPTLSILNDRGFSYRTAPDDSLQAVVAAGLAADEHGASSAATLYIAGDYGRQLSGAFATSFDGEVQRQVSFSDAYEEPLATALADDPDLLFVIGYPEDGVEIFTHYYDGRAGDETVFTTDGMMDPSLPEQVGEPMSNVYGTAPSSNGPGYDAFAERYESEYGRSPGIFTANGYDAAAVLLLANAAAGENDGGAIREQMRAVASEGGTEVTPETLAEGVRRAAAGDPVEYRGASSEVVFDENGDVSGIDYEYFRYDADGISVIETVSPEVEA